MLVGEVMTPDPVVVAPTTTLREARSLAQRLGIRHLPVLYQERLTGMLTPHELVDDANALLRAAAGFEPRGQRSGRQEVAAVMQPAYPVVGPELPVESAARLLLVRHRSGVAVLDKRVRLVGILTTTDLLAAGMSPTEHATAET